MNVDWREKHLEHALSSIQAKLADAQDLLLAAGREIDDLYAGLEDAPRPGGPNES